MKQGFGYEKKEKRLDSRLKMSGMTGLYYGYV